MSLFACSSTLKKRAKKISKDSYEYEFITSLRQNLDKAVQNDFYEDLPKHIKEIKAFNKDHGKRKYLVGIQADLENISNRFNKIREKHDAQDARASVSNMAIKNKNTFDILNKFNDCKIANIEQGNNFRLGKSNGECLGFTYSMAYPNSPFKEGRGRIKDVEFTRVVYKHQKNQSNRQKDQSTIKTIRHTRKHFSTNFRQQAEDCYVVAEKNKDKEFNLVRFGSCGAHATYFSVRNNGEIWYMEPNFGAYIFHSKEAFIDYYDACSEVYTKSNAIFLYHELDELRYDPENHLKESRTWSGVYRSFITGAKYNGTSSSLSNVISGLFIPTSIGVAAGSVLGAAIGALAGSVIPGVGTLIGAAVGGSVGGVVAGIGMAMLSMKHTGFLAPWNFLRTIIGEWKVKKELTQEHSLDVSLQQKKLITSLSKPINEQNKTTTSDKQVEKRENVTPSYNEEKMGFDQLVHFKNYKDNYCQQTTMLNPEVASENRVSCASASA